MSAAHAWLVKLVEANRMTGRYPREPFQRTVAERWWAICAASTHLGLWTLTALRRSPLWGDMRLDWKQQVKFGVKCGIRKRQHA